MDRDYHKTLFYPFERSEIRTPGAGEKALIVGALHPVGLPRDWAAKTDWVQGLRPNFLAFERAGLDVSPEFAGRDYDAIAILCGRHRGQNEAWIGEALQRTRMGGLILVAGGKQEGIDSLKKRLAPSVAIEGSLSKSHGTAFWFRAPSEIPDGLIAAKASPFEKNSDGFFTAPGMFAHKKADPGSILLAQCLPSGVIGSAADFGAGWGYLSAALLRSSPELSSLDIFEADFSALQAARLNVEPLAGGARLEFHWADLLQEQPARRFDLVVMNPPFHAGRAAEPDIGAGMIEAASRALKPGGHLFMVANRNLPYEKTLKASFARVEEIRNEDGYKVIHGRR
jgi:16S rRNA (guanine1207-N2)-methyltransferase